MLPRLDKSTLDGANLYAAFCLAFAAFLKCGEFTHASKDTESPNFDAWHLTRKSVNSQADQLTISLPTSKTDPFRHGITLTVAATNDEACAVKPLKHLIRQFPTLPNAPLFNQSKGAFTRDFVIINLRSILTNLGLEGNYSGHSFGRGASTSVKEAGLIDSDIQMLGRWKIRRISAIQSDSSRIYFQHFQTISNTPSFFLNLSVQSPSMPFMGVLGGFDIIYLRGQANYSGKIGRRCGGGSTIKRNANT